MSSSWVSCSKIWAEPIERVCAVDRIRSGLGFCFISAAGSLETWTHGKAQNKSDRPPSGSPLKAMI